MKIYKLINIILSVILIGCTASEKGLKNNNKMSSAEIHKLLVEIKTADKETRAKYINKISNIGKSAVETLISELSNPDADVQESAAALLGIIGDPKAVEPLIQGLQGGIKRKYIAAWSLSKLHDTRAIPPLIKALEDENFEVRKYATRALISFSKNAVNPLIEVIISPHPNVRACAARALGEISSKEAVLPILSIINDENDDVSSSAAWALGKLGDERAVEPLIKLLRHKNKIIRINAARSLGIIGSKNAKEILEKVLVDDEEFVVREWAARALENITGNRYKYKNANDELGYPYNLYR